MRTFLFLPAAALLASAALAQTPARPATAPLVKPDPNSAANIGRTQLTTYLDNLAGQYTSTRRATIASITTRAQAEARQREVREKILTLIGGLPEKTPLNAKVTGSTQADGFRMEKVLYESQPNFFVTAIFYLPDNHPNKLPAIIVAPGHGPTGKTSDYAFASVFARNGFAVLSWDPEGQGERLQYPDPQKPGQSLATRPTGEHGEAGLQPTLIGDALARYAIWDGIRAVDYLLSRPEVDANRIGAFGCSGGGTLTANFAALDTRVKTIGTACYITNFDAMLPGTGPQDGEQSIPRFVSSGLDLTDWVELAAPRSYAVISTASDMFPWPGAYASVTEARRFYSLLDKNGANTAAAPSKAAISTIHTGPAQRIPSIESVLNEQKANADKAEAIKPTGPTLNPDAPDTPPTATLQWITGIGGHGNLRPLTAQIVSFFLVHLAKSDAKPILPPPPAPGASPFALPAGISAEAFQVTPTGQVLTSYPNSATIHTLNLKRYQALPKPKPLTPTQLQQAVREVTHAVATPGETPLDKPLMQTLDGNGIVFHLTPLTDPGVKIDIGFYRPTEPSRHPLQIILRDRLDTLSQDETDHFISMAKSGTAVAVICPRPSPPGTEETKSPILGPFYISELRAELVGKTLLGLRVDDTIRAINLLTSNPSVDPTHITAEADGHLGLVLLHAAILDPRLKHIAVTNVLESYDSLIKAPMPLDAPQDILPGVVRHYDIPDLIKSLGPRATVKDSLPGTANLSQPELQTSAGKHP